MVSILFKEILSSPLQDVSSVGISTLELPVILSFPTGSACSWCYQHGCTTPPTWSPLLSGAAYTKSLSCAPQFLSAGLQSPVLFSFTCTTSPLLTLATVPCSCVAPWVHSCCWAVCGTADTSSRPGLIWLKEGIHCFSSIGTGYPPKWVNWFRSISQEKSNRSVSQSQNRFPDSPSSFWICVGFSPLFIRYLELLCLLAVLIYYKLITYFVIYFCFPKYLPSAIWLWFEFRSKKNEATRQPLWGAQTRVDLWI